MKTIEEKAKAYDEALERAKAYHRNELTGSRKEMMEYIFPQLCESDDEKIRKKLVQFLTDVKNISEDSRNSWAVRKEDAEMCATFLAYLEKQKEQKPISFNEPYNPDEYEVVMEGNATSIKRKEQKPTWSEEDERIVGRIQMILEFFDRNYPPDMNIGSEIPKYISWLKSLRPQPKQEWSEEDEKTRNLAIEWAETMYGQFRFVDMGSTDFRKIVAWLKSIRPFWKPSEEQMEVLLNAEGLVRANNYNENAKILASLYEDLKRL